MAKIGLKYPVVALATEAGSAISYASGTSLGKAIMANINITTNNVKLYADDALAESDRSFSSGAITVGADDLTDAVRTLLFGYTEGAEVDAVLGSNELSAGTATEPALIGLGFYSKRVKSGVVSYRAIWLKKVKFAEPSEEYATKGESVEFKTPSLEGDIMMAADGKWKEEGTFSTESGAIAWLNGKSGISAAVSNNITALTFSNGTFTPTFAAGTYNYSVALSNTPTVITATFAAGTCKVYVDGVYNQDLTTTVAGAGIAVADGANKLIQLVVQESGKTAVTYNVMTQNANP
jgi:phi13 family phage major tail protein